MMAEKNDSPKKILIGYLIDIFAPMAIYFLLRKFGLSPFVSLIVGSLIAIASTVVNTVRRKKLDAIGIVVILEIGVSIVWLFLAHNAKLLLIKPSLYSGVAAVYVMINAIVGKPLSFEGGRPMATQGDPQRNIAYERTWERSAKFRKAQRIATFGLGIALLSDALLRIIIVEKFAVDRAIWLSTAPNFFALALFLGFAAFMGRKTKPLVEEQVRQLAAETAAAQNSKSSQNAIAG
ncbi:MAG TPA: VC0807 family protein [Terriglobales bacterium]